MTRFVTLAKCILLGYTFTDRLQKNLLLLVCAACMEQIAVDLHKQGLIESAKVLMRRRKLVQKRVQLTTAQLDRIEQMISNIEGQEANVVVLDAIEEGTKTLQVLNASVTIERAEKIMEESRDTAAYTQEVSQLLADSKDDTEIDDNTYADILEELEQFAKQADATKATTEATVEPTSVEDMHPSPAGGVEEDATLQEGVSTPLESVPEYAVANGVKSGGEIPEQQILADDVEVVEVVEVVDDVDEDVIVPQSAVHTNNAKRMQVAV